MARQAPASSEKIRSPIPETLSKHERWIVRLNGVDMGPFSSYQLYPKLLTGEIDPETLLLDQERFTRYRLNEIPEFKEYLHLHNTENPILLEEQRQREREEYWQNTGKKRVYLGVALVFLLAIGGFATYRIFFYKSQDVYMSDGDYIFSMSQYRTQKIEKKTERKWTWKSRRRRRRSKSKKGKAAGPAVSAIDFSAGGGDGIPRRKIHNILKRNIRSVFGCFKRQMERDNSFGGGEIVFRISGATGKIIHTRIDGKPELRILNKCIRRNSRSWSFPRFQGNAVIHYPIYVRRKTRW